ncbi:flagellar protein FlgN [Pseudoxanthomonas mexicana]|uniref:flagellar protein FlgN n=1 Tax=Pseudoxanthomonas mexicana TaxID=128785 RepID=UPI00398B4BA8
MNPALSQSLERLEAALNEERRAILEHDVQALIQSTRDKLESLRALETRVHDADSQLLEPRLVELSQLNLANGALLARRRREVNWALRHLGRSESAPAYDASGRAENLQPSRPLAVV